MYNINKLGIYFAIIFTLSLAACSGGSDNTKEPPSLPVLQSLVIEGIETSYIEGTQDEIFVSGVYDNGTSSAISGITWTSSNEEIATVNSDNTLISLSPGTTTITASLNDLQVSSDINITEAVLNSLTIFADANSLPAGLQLYLTARGTFNNDKTEDVTGVTWISSDESLAIIDALGQVNTYSPGNVQFSAEIDNLTAAYDLTITPAELKNLNISVNNTSAPVGYTLEAIATGIYTDSSSLSISAEWSSNDSQIFEVNDNGIITAISVGEAQLSASSNGIIAEPITINITNAVATSLEVSKTNLDIPLGLSSSAKATLNFSDSSSQPAEGVSWVSDNPSIAKITSEGNQVTVQAKSIGNTTVHAFVDDYEASLDITVTDAVIQDVTILINNNSLAAGTETQLELQGVLSDATTQNVTGSATWSISDNGLGNLSAPTDSSIRLTAGSPGEGFIKASYMSFEDTVSFTVTDAIEIGLTSIPTETINIPLGLNQDVSFMVEYSDNSQAELSSGVTWSVSDTELGNVIADGSSTAIVSGVKEGAFTLTAEYSEWSFAVPVGITAAQPVELMVDELSIYADDKPQQMSATMTYTDDSTQNVTDIVSWSSSDTSIASVSNAEGTKGLVTPNSEGEVIISASFNGGEFEYSQTILINPAKLITGFIIHNYGQDNYIDIGEGAYQISLRFSGETGTSVYFYNDENAGVGLSNGATNISDITDASIFNMESRTVGVEQNSTNSVAVAKNSDNYYAVIQVHEVRNDGRDGSIDIVVFSWAIRTDGENNFSNFTQQTETKLLKCQEADFFGNNGGCKEVVLPYSTVASRQISSLPRPDAFELGDFTIISIGQGVTITNLLAKDSTNTVAPYFDGISNPSTLPTGHGKPFKLMIPATNNQTTSPSFMFDIDDNAAKAFSYSGTFKSN